jgi:hypothetical protein
MACLNTRIKVKSMILSVMIILVRWIGKIPNNLILWAKTVSVSFGFSGQEAFWNRCRIKFPVTTKVGIFICQAVGRNLMREHHQVSLQYCDSTPGFTFHPWHEYCAKSTHFTKTRHCYRAIGNLQYLDQNISTSLVIFNAPSTLPVLIYSPYLANTWKNFIFLSFTCHSHHM